MYSVVSSFSGERHRYNCDWCGDEQDGRTDEKNPQAVALPLGWYVDCGPGLNPQARIGIFCGVECRDAHRLANGIRPRRDLYAEKAATEEVAVS